MTDFTDEQQLIELIEQAHLAGQAEAGIDPSYSNAQIYAREATSPKPKFGEGQIIVTPSGNVYAKYSLAFDNGKVYAGYRHLTPTELGPAVRELRDAMRLLSEHEYLHSMKNEDEILYRVEIAAKALAAFDAVHGEK